MEECTTRRMSYKKLFFSLDAHCRVIVCWVTWAGLLLGYDSGFISAAIIRMKEKFPEIQNSKCLEGTIISMGLAGAILGVELGRSLNYRRGRKSTSLVAAVSILSGALLTIMAPAPWLICIGRMLVGNGVAVASTTAPLYVSEIFPSKIRSLLIVYGILIIFGQFSAHVDCWTMERDFRWLVLVKEVVYGLFLLTFARGLPESPRWLLRKGKTDKAFNILRQLYCGKELDEEFQALKYSAYERTTGTGNILTTVKDGWNIHLSGNSLATGIALSVLKQPAGGVKVVIYYALPILEFAGISHNVVVALSLFISSLNVLSSIFAYRYSRVKCI